jgi:hypothetical protein
MLVNALRTVRGGTLVAMIATVAVSGTAAPIPAERAKAEKELVAFGTKLHGAWHGDVGCQGTITFKADGTYQWIHRGPGGHRDTGAWALRGEVPQPVLILKCKTSQDDRAGTTVEVKLTLEGTGLAFQHANPPMTETFTRMKEKEPRTP